MAASDLTLAEVRRVFPAAQSIARLDGKVPAYMVRDDRGQLGYAFSTESVAPISAYSGKPINTVVGLGEDGLIRGVYILHHEEPILVIGISDKDLQDFIDQFGDYLPRKGAGLFHGNAFCQGIAPAREIMAGHSRIH